MRARALAWSAVPSDRTAVSTICSAKHRRISATSGQSHHVCTMTIKHAAVPHLSIAVQPLHCMHQSGTMVPHCF
jgi:hypothetical protein